MISLVDIMKGKPVDYFPDALHKLHDDVLSRISLDDMKLPTIMFHVSLITGIPEKDIRSKVRKREMVYARQLFAYFAVTKTKLTLEKIGEYVYEGYDHSTVLYSRRTIDDLLFYNKTVQQDVDKIKQSMYGIK